MDTQIQFQKDANVLSADGKQLGTLDRLVVNPETKILTAIVVRSGGLLSHEERVIPIESVAETSGELIVLRDTLEDLTAFPPFEERHSFDENQTENPLAASTKNPPVVTGYPVMGAPLIIDPNEALGTHIEQNIPEGTVAMKEGAKVITAEGKHVGNVERVLVDPSVEQVTYLVISKGLLTKEARLIPMYWVLTLGEDKVHLRVNESSVNELGSGSVAV